MFDTMHYEERAPAAAEMNVSSFLPTTKEGEINAAGLGNVHFYLSASTSHCKFLTSKTPVCDPVCKMLWNITCGKGLPAPPPLNCLCWHFYAHTPRQTLHLVSRLDLEDETRNLLFPVRFISSSRWDVAALPKYCFHRLSFMEAIIVLNVCHWFSRFSKVRVVSLIPMLVSYVQ